MVKCNECDKVFKKQAGWKNHYNVTHWDPTAPKLYNCTHQGCDYASNRCVLISRPARNLEPFQAAQIPFNFLGLKEYTWPNFRPIGMAVN